MPQVPPTTGPAPADRSPSKAPAVVALTTGSVLVLGGIATFVFGVRGARDDYFDTCAKQITPNCENDAGKSKVRLLEGISYGAIGLGIVGVGVGAYLLLRPDAQSYSGVSISPSVGGARIVFLQRF